MSFSGFIVQLINGLASASSLFLVAAGLSLIFGVTRIVNFAHGSFFMVGIYVAYSLVERLSGALGVWVALPLAALIVGVLGALIVAGIQRELSLPALKASFRPVGSKALDPGLVPMEDAVRAGLLRNGVARFGRQLGQGLERDLRADAVRVAQAQGHARAVHRGRRAAHSGKAMSVSVTVLSHTATRSASSSLPSTRTKRSR